MFRDYHGGKFIDEYKDYDKAQIKPILPIEEQIARAQAEFNIMAQTIQNILKPIIENMCSIIFPVAIKYCDILNTYPNKRVVYLALHHGKHRVRKKNINRIKNGLRGRGKNEKNTF